jgi:hypothetical protein
MRDAECTRVLPDPLLPLQFIHIRTFAGSKQIIRGARYQRLDYAILVDLAEDSERACGRKVGVARR